MNIILLRHAQSFANKKGIIDAILPGTALTTEGIKHVNTIRPSVISFLKGGLSKCYCSPFQRALQTFKFLKIKIPLIIDERIREIDYGLYNGKNLNDVSAGIKAIFRRATDDKSMRDRFGINGENYLELILRVYSFLMGIIRKNENVLIISHEAILIEIEKIWRKLRGLEIKNRSDTEHSYEKPLKLLFNPGDICWIQKARDELELTDYSRRMHTARVKLDNLITNVVKEITGSEIYKKKRIISGEVSEVYDALLGSGRNIIIKVVENNPACHIREQFAIKQCLKMGGIPVPHMWPIRNLLVNSNNLSFCIQEKIKGESLKKAIRSGRFTQKQKRKIINSAGDFLAKIHRIKIEGFGYIKSDLKGCYDSFSDLLRQHSSRSDLFFRIADEVGIRENIMRSIIDLLTQKANKAPKLEPILSHNDYTLSHIMINHYGKITAIIDWSEAQGNFCFNDFAKWDYICKEEAPTEWLLEGYSAPFLFNEEYNNLLHWFRLNIGLGALSWYFSRNDLAGIERTKDELLKDLRYFS